MLFKLMIANSFATMAALRWGLRPHLTSDGLSGLILFVLFVPGVAPRARHMAPFQGCRTNNKNHNLRVQIISPLTTHHSPLTTHHSPLTTHD